MLKLPALPAVVWVASPAAFRRLCVETAPCYFGKTNVSQPPLGGCVLKPRGKTAVAIRSTQPPLGGCVLKQAAMPEVALYGNQPPLGGCVLKQSLQTAGARAATPAAFRRLCVETTSRCL